MTFSNDLILEKLEMLMDKIFLIKSLMNNISSSLPLVIEHFQSLESCSSIRMVTVRRMWSNNNLYSGWIAWLSNSTELYLRNMRLMTEFKLWSLSKYLVGVEYNRPNKRESVMSISKLLYKEQWGNNRSQKLFLILKSPAMARILEMSTPVSLKYFKADCKESE